jgi:hypothetical protein
MKHYYIYKPKMEECFFSSKYEKLITTSLKIYEIQKFYIYELLKYLINFF